MKLQSSSSKNYRTDINGLRAWAVMAVILFHFRIVGFSGGFIGVDTFFVISGFLMTSIIIENLEKGNFSILQFYGARSRRILPALIFLCATLIALGVIFLLPNDFKTLCTHAIASLGFFSNFFYWHEAGYFDASSNEKWLLHTWSLSVEWQYYLLLPLILKLVWIIRPGRLAQAIGLSVVGILSIILDLTLTAPNPTSSFFMLHTRAWEMIAGGLSYLLGSSLNNKTLQKSFLEKIGFFLLCIAITYFNSTTPWPNWQALVPVIGTSLILISNNSSSLTGNTIAQWLGARSYSLYLWHWPIYVALFYLNLQAQPIALLLSAIVVFTLGDFSFKYIETISQKILKSKSDIYNLVAPTIVATGTAFVALFVWYSDGISGRFSREIELIASESGNLNPRGKECDQVGSKPPGLCTYGKGELKAILIGDSHGESVITALAAALPADQGSVKQWTYKSCPTILGIKPAPGSWASGIDGYDCNGFIKWAIHELDSIPEDIPLIVVNRSSSPIYGANDSPEKFNVPSIYFTKPHPKTDPEIISEYISNLKSTLCQLAKRRTVYVVQPIPEMGINVPKVASRRMSMGLDGKVEISLSNYNDRHKTVISALDEAQMECGVKILDPAPYLCDKDKCAGLRNDRPIYYDDNHLSEYGNKFLTPMFSIIFAANIQLPVNVKY